MSMYLLLRDNKESGPYSFDELKAKGLKAYDLVWVENKSAAWRYPCEVEELSSFAPAVEEQPFDRFYKKTSSEKDVVAAKYQQKQGEPSAIAGKRIIYVTLPAGKNNPARESSPREIVKSPVIFPDRTVSSYSPSPVLPEASLEEKSAQTPVDRNAAVEIMPRANRRPARTNVLQSVAVVLCVIALLAAGIFIGLSINKDNLGFSQKIAAKKDPVNPPPPVNHPAISLPASSAVPSMQVKSPDTTSTTNLSGAETTIASNTNTLKKPVITGKAKSAQPSQKVQPTPPSLIKDSAMVGIPVIHREASHRTDMPGDKIDKEVIRNNLSSLISVGTNGYTVGTFGGISGVQLTVSNKSVYPLDLVVVEVQYIQANKKVFKTENLYFRGIGPGSALMQEAPNSSRGIKVQYKITLVNSKELGLSYSTL